jgi:hypothetical protein
MEKRMNANRRPGSSGTSWTEFMNVESRGRISITAHIEQEVEGILLPVYVEVKKADVELLSKCIYDINGADKNLAIQEAIRKARVSILTEK